MGAETQRDTIQSYLDKMMKITPVYIIGLLAIVEPALRDFTGADITQQIVGVAIVLVLGIVALAVFEGVGRKLGRDRKLQIGLVSFTSCLYIIVGSWRAMGQDIISFPTIGPFIPVFLAGWIFLAPLILFRYSEEGE
ncbi:MAG: hypothetical protein KAQ65_10230 [Candidatus Thorarchaeota archaeon]|nr:hypothetical protein [Candidatus Thorarchaeota archaeon]